jgi:hypothetical protein
MPYAFGLLMYKFVKERHLFAFFYLLDKNYIYRSVATNVFLTILN